MWREILIALVAAIMLGWLALVVIRPKGNLVGESLRIPPDLIRLLKRLSTDSTQPRDPGTARTPDGLPGLAH